MEEIGEEGAGDVEAGGAGTIEGAMGETARAVGVDPRGVLASGVVKRAPLVRSYSVRIECRWCMAGVYVYFADDDDEEKRAARISEGIGKIEHDPKFCVGGMTDANDRLIGDLFAK